MLRTRPPRESPERNPARLACIRHAASVDPEPGSNSPPICLQVSEEPAGLVCVSHTCNQGRESNLPALTTLVLACVLNNVTLLLAQTRLTTRPRETLQCVARSVFGRQRPGSRRPPRKKDPIHPLVLPACQRARPQRDDQWPDQNARRLLARHHSPNVPWGEALAIEPAELTVPVPPCQGWVRVRSASPETQQWVSSRQPHHPTTGHMLCQVVAPTHC